MDIRSGSPYPANALSNFAPHSFVVDGVQCSSMEGFLQSLKFSSIDMQQHVCTLVGVKAKYKGKHKNWWRDQTLYWGGHPIGRHTQDYQNLLDRAYEALGQNEGFKKALLATGDAVIRHSMGKKDPSHTVLTEREFCSRLMRLRDKLKSID